MKYKAISIYLTAFALCAPVAAFSQDAAGGGIDQKIGEIFNTVFGPFVSFIFYSVSINGVSFPLIVAWLILCAFILTVYGVYAVHGYPAFNRPASRGLFKS
jgi:hypothetical protein